MHSSTSRRRSRRIAGVAAIAALAVVIAGCSSTKPNAGTDTASAPLNGVTASTIKVGLTIVDLGQLATQLGFKQADYGGVSGQTKAINAVVDYINKNGGMGGRQVQPVIKTYLGSTDSPQQSQAQCSAYTQDEKVFGVILDGGLQNNAVPCYKAANTLVLDETLIAHDTQQFQENSPYLWSPTHPEYASFVKAELTAMNNAKFFDGNTGVLLMPSDDEVSRRTTDTIVKPFLTSIGVTKSQTSYVDSTNTGTLGASSAAALTAGKNGKLNRVIVIGGARIQPVALSDQNANNYPSTWGISTYDNPTFLQSNTESIVSTLRNGMVGLGYAPDYDLVQNTGPAFPDTTNPMQQKCYDIISQAGATPPQNLRSNWKPAFQYCDGLMFLKAALDKLPGTATVTGEQFKNAVGQIGGPNGYRSSMTFGASWGPNVYAGTNAGQTLAWDSATNAYVYTGATQTFGAVSPGVAPTTAGAATSAPPASTPAPTAASTLGTTPSTPAGAATDTVDPLSTITAYTQ